MRKIIALFLAFASTATFGTAGCGAALESSETADEEAVSEAVSATAQAVEHVPDSCKNRELACARVGLGAVEILDEAAKHALEASMQCAGSALLGINELPEGASLCIHYENGHPHLSDLDCVMGFGSAILCALAPCFVSTGVGHILGGVCAIGKIGVSAFECYALKDICEQDKQNQKPIDETQCPFGKRTTVQACALDSNGNLNPRTGGQIDADCRKAVNNLGLSSTGSTSADWYNCEHYCFSQTINNAKACAAPDAPALPPAPVQPPASLPTAPVQAPVPLPGGVGTMGGPAGPIP